MYKKSKRWHELNFLCERVIINYVSHSLWNENLSLTRIRSLYEKSDGMEIRITNDEYYKYDPGKSC